MKAISPATHGNLLICSLLEAQQQLGDPVTGDSAAAPALARRLRAAGAACACIVGLTGEEGRLLHWLDGEHAQGWLAPAIDGTGQSIDSGSFAGHFTDAVERGFVPADAAVLATMATTAVACGAGAQPQFIDDPALLPQLSWDEQPRFADHASAGPGTLSRRIDLYPIVDSAQRVQQAVAAGVRTVQLRIKKPAAPDGHWHAMLRREVQQSIASCEAAGAELFINDHWQLAGELGAHGVHLGQEDLLALGAAGRAALQRSGVALGVSSHSLWELCRARSLAPRYIACGPVWPTITKDMPWRAQGLDNLAWWCRMAGAPVVAIGGLLGADQVRQAARCGADGVCMVRGLGAEPGRVVPVLQAALETGRAQAAPALPGAWPHPSLAFG